MKKLTVIIISAILACALLTVGVIAGGKSSPTQQGVTGTADSGDLKVTPVLEEDAASADVVKRIDDAKAQLEKNEADLTALCADLKSVKDIKDYAVIDVVDVVWGEKTQKTVDAKGFVEVKFDTKLAKDSQLHVLFNDMRGGEWKCIDDQVTVNKDGSVTIKVNEMGVFAFLVK